MARRCPKAMVVGDAVLYGWKQDGLNIYKNKSGEVQGLLWDITDKCLASLDIYEGYPTIYIRHTVRVVTDDGEVEALVYRIPVRQE